MRKFLIGWRGCSPDKRASLVAAAAFAVALATSQAAQADCTPQAASSVTATCTGTTFDQGGGAPGSSASINGYGTSTELGITVKVAPAALVTGMNTGITIFNGTVINNTGARIAGGTGNGIAAQSLLEVVNSGSITGQEGITSLIAAVTNNAGASITGQQYGINSVVSATVTNSGSITANVFDGVVTGTDATVTNNAGASIIGTRNGISALAGDAHVINSGSITGASNAGILASNATVTNNAGASITGGIDGISAFGTANVINSGSIIGATIGIRALVNVAVTNNAGASIVGASYGIFAGPAGPSSVFNAGTISGSGVAAIQFFGVGNTLTLAPGSAITGNVLGTGSDTFQLGGNGTATFDVSQIGPAAQYRGFGTFNKIGSSTWTLTGASPFAGPVTVADGTLAVNGDIHSASHVTVNAGGTLGGNGIVSDTTINGGTLAPGNSIGLLTVQGNLVFTAAASYMVEVSSANADRVDVTGAAALGGAAVNASFASGTFVVRQYTILNAAGGVTGTFGSLNTNLPSAFKASLSYDANDAYLNLALNFAASGGLNINQQNVANALTNFFNTTGGIPLVFGALTPSGLTQVSGESATGSQQTTFDAMNLFMGVLTDPFMGRGDGVNGASSASGYAEENTSVDAASRKPADALAMFIKAPPAPFVQRWSVWASAYGGSQSTSGNAIVGSNDTTSRIAGTAVGADYLFSPNTLAGFALAGGGTNFSVNNLGSGRSDLFQAGVYVRHTDGAAYLTGALAYGWQDITADRVVTIAGIDHLRAEFNANAYSGRVEGGYRLVAPWIGVGLTPYAAGQFTTFDLPAYAESVVSGGGNFALAYASKSVTATRSELGFRSDKSFAMQDGLFTLRGRAAWAHDYNTDRNIAATFQALPGASFVVNGAAQAADAALTTVSAEWKWRNGWSAAATFEGEFSQVTRSYAGKGVARYTW